MSNPFSALSNFQLGTYSGTSMITNMDRQVVGAGKLFGHAQGFTHIIGGGYNETRTYDARNGAAANTWERREMVAGGMSPEEARAIEYRQRFGDRPAPSGQSYPAPPPAYQQPGYAPGTYPQPQTQNQGPTGAPIQLNPSQNAHYPLHSQAPSPQAGSLPEYRPGMPVGPYVEAARVHPGSAAAAPATAPAAGGGVTPHAAPHHAPHHGAANRAHGSHAAPHAADPQVQKDQALIEGLGLSTGQPHPVVKNADGTVDPTKLDGDFGRTTRRSTLLVQTALGITNPNGQMTDETRAKLTAELDDPAKAEAFKAKITTLAAAMPQSGQAAGGPHTGGGNVPHARPQAGQQR